MEKRQNSEAILQRTSIYRDKGLCRENNYTEKKSIDGSYEPLSEEEITYVKSLIERACVNLEFEDLLKPPSIDDQIDEFIKEFFDEEDDPVEQKDFLSDFFKELEDEEENK